MKAPRQPSAPRLSRRERFFLRPMRPLVAPPMRQRGRFVLVAACFLLAIVALSLVPHATAASSSKSGKKCDVTVGSWIPSSKYPQYQNDCPYITDNYNCIKNGRPDGDFQHLLWKPNGCDLTIFDPKSFAARFVGQSIAIAGDSTGQYLFQSLRCRISEHYTTEDWDPKMVGWTGQGFKVKLLGVRVILVDAPFLMEAWPDVEGESKASHLWHVQLDSINHKILEMLPNIPKLKALILVASNYYLPQPATTTVSVNNSAYSSYISNQRIYYSQGKPQSPQPTPQDALFNALKTVSAYFDKNLQLVRPFFLTMPPSHNPNLFRYADTTCGLFASPLQADAMSYAAARSDATTWTTVQRQALSNSKIKLLDVLQMSMYRADGHMAAYGPPPMQARWTARNGAFRGCRMRGSTCSSTRSCTRLGDLDRTRCSQRVFGRSFLRSCLGLRRDGWGRDRWGRRFKKRLGGMGWGWVGAAAAAAAAAAVSKRRAQSARLLRR
ncbi:hypothetical protein CLOM_g6617 [Closterium sp. NIES-68]|nr:hypothetical protein CLOM_g6617 [Closterium sp. NIES-68]